MCLVSVLLVYVLCIGLVSGPCLGPSLCPECVGIGTKWAKQVSRVPSDLSYCEYYIFI